MAAETKHLSNSETAGREVILGFSPESVRASFLLRCGALTIDYLLIVAAPVTFLFLSRFAGNSGTALLNGELNNIGWMVAALVTIADLILLPMMLGQSVGKLLTGLRIVNRDGSAARASKLLIRQTIGYAIIILTLGLGFIMCAFSRQGRGLHDMLTGTIVIQARKEAID